ncbi:MAG: dynamin family protein [Candidatus Bilamarchaeaceae archaeon]
MRSEEFVSKKTTLLEIIERLRKFDGGLNEKLDRLVHNIESESFTIAVAGQFKRGKTTLINAMLGQSLLPTAVLPLTSVITVIRYGPRPRVLAVHQDCREEEIKPEEIELYVTEKHNPKNVKGIQRVEIEVPSRFLEQGVVLVDTPGIGSVYRHNSDVAYRFLPDADAIIFVLSADPPISEAECQFLEESSKYASKFFFVLNKIDYLGESEIKELLEFNRGVLASKLKVDARSIRLFPLSARNALEQKLAGKRMEKGLADFENMLEDFIVSKKGAFVLSASESKIKYIIEELVNRLLVEKSNLRVSQSELEERMKKFEDALGHILSKKEYNDGLIDIEQKKILEVVGADLDKLKREVTEPLVKKIVSHADSLENRDNQKFAAAVGDYLQEEVLHVLEPWRNSEQEKISKMFEERMKKYSTSVNEIISEVEKTASGLFDVEIKSRKTEERLTMESTFYFKLDKSEEITMLSMMDLLLPKSLFKKRLLSRLPAEIEEVVDRNCGRMRYDFLERMQKSVLQFKWTLSEKVDAAVNGIRAANESAIKIRMMGEEKMKRRFSEIEQELAELKRLMEKLER